MGAETKTRGELAEIAVQLDNLSKFGGTKPETVAAKQELFKKIINYATIGIDMSRLFMQVIKCAASSNEDVVLKKMLYLFITTNAQSNADLALLTVNLLTKDCRDQDPTIRGLALRSLCSMRINNMLEYLVAPVKMGLSDPHPYVRRTAVLGVLKVYHLDTDVVRDQGLLDEVRSMALNDNNAQVVSNCLSVLERVGEAKALVQRQYVVSLINRIKDFSEWGQCQVLEIVAHYRPTSEDELYDIMNVLDDRLSHSNSAVVLAAVKVFLHLTLHLPATHQQVLERCVSPLQTLMSADHYESAYAVLCNVRTLAQRAPFIFSQIYPTLYCRVHEPSYIKRLKLEVLAEIADESNAYDIVTELTEYANDIDEELARQAVNAVGQIALKVPDVGGIVERLIGFLEVGKDHITAETIIQMKDLLRRYPDIAEICIASIGAINPASIEETAARAAFVWILGQYGKGIQDAPYLLEPMAAKFASEEVPVRLALLTAAAKLFLERPPECQNLLGGLLAAGSQDANQDVHDRALMYYRLFAQDVNRAKDVVNAALPHLVAFSEEQSAELRDRIFDEFNTLSVVYNAPSTSFLDAEGPMYESFDLNGAPPAGAAANGAAAHATPVDEGSSLLMGADDMLGLDTASPQAAQPAAAAAAAGTATNGSSRPAGGLDALADLGLGPSSSSAAPVPGPSGGGLDLLGMDDLLGGLSIGGGAAGAAPPPPPALTLRQGRAMSPPDFQKRWGGFTAVERSTVQLQPATLQAIEANKHQDFVRYTGSKGLATIASGGSAPTYRFYMHAQREGGGPDAPTYLVEIIVSTAAASAALTLKSDDAASLGDFKQLMEKVIASFP